MRSGNDIGTKQPRAKKVAHETKHLYNLVSVARTAEAAEDLTAATTAAVTLAAMPYNTLAGDTCAWTHVSRSSPRSLV